jgi:hypothetical protein
MMILGSQIVCGVSTFQKVLPLDALGIFNDLAGEFGRLGCDAIRNDVGTLDAASIQICTKSFTLNTTDFVFD